MSYLCLFFTTTTTTITITTTTVTTTTTTITTPPPSPSVRSTTTAGGAERWGVEHDHNFVRPGMQPWQQASPPHHPLPGLNSSKQNEREIHLTTHTNATYLRTQSFHVVHQHHMHNQQQFHTLSSVWTPRVTLPHLFTIQNILSCNFCPPLIFLPVCIRAEEGKMCLPPNVQATT